MSERNADQIAFWNSSHGTAWARNADITDVMFSDITEAIVSEAAINVGDYVLDLGCGTGGNMLAVANRVGSAGFVTAIDVSNSMIDRAEERCRANNLKNVTCIRGDAAAYTFSDASFSKLISCLGAMFFDDPAIAFTRLRQTLKPGGRIALGVWREPRENPWAMELVAAAKKYLNMLPRPGPEEPGPFSFAKPDRVRNVLAGTGLRDIELSPLDFVIPHGRSMSDALTFVMKMGPLAGPLSEASGENQVMALDAIKQVLKKNTGDDGIVRMAGACWIVTARAD